jgi:hypothetical protein
MTTSIPRGEAPISPDEPFDEDAYDAVIAAMDDLIEQADAQPVEEGPRQESPAPRAD